jgi:serine/threonine protein phosphatase PrpC
MDEYRAQILEGKAMSSSEPAEIEYSATSETGPVRDDNQDSVWLPEGYSAVEQGLLVAVADGMGGYSHGKLASSLALEKLFQTFYSETGPAKKTLRKALEAANLNVYQTTQRLGVGRMGTTLTAIHILGNRLHVAHVGDSRAYLVRGGEATCLTNDHTTVGELVRMKVLSPDKVRQHAQRSVLNQCLGLALFIKPDITETVLNEGDTLVLCSDGVWSVIEDDEFAALAGEILEPEMLSRRLVELALERETDDNASAVVVRVRHLGTVPEEVRSGGKLAHFLRGFDRAR